MRFVCVADTEVAGRDQDETVLTHQSKPGPAVGLSLVLRHLAALQIKRFHHSRWVVVRQAGRCDTEPSLQAKPARLHL